MTRAEVEGLLGGPPGEYGGQPPFDSLVMEEMKCSPFVIYVDNPRLRWWGDDVAIEVIFWMGESEVFEARLYRLAP